MTEKFIWGWLVARLRRVLSYKSKSKARGKCAAKGGALRAYFFPALPGWAKFVPRLRRWWFAGWRAWMAECSGRCGISSFEISNEEKTGRFGRCNVKDAGRRPAVRNPVLRGVGPRMAFRYGQGTKVRRTESRRSQAWRFSVWLRGRRLKPTLLDGGDAAWGRWI